MTDIDDEIVFVRTALIERLSDTCLVDTSVGEDGIPDYVDDLIMPAIREMVTNLTGYVNQATGNAI